MATDGKKPGWAFWATVALLVALVVYPLSIGPVFWILVWAGAPQPALTAVGYFYFPLGFVIQQSPSMKAAYIWYIEVGLPR